MLMPVVMSNAQRRLCNVMHRGVINQCMHVPLQANEFLKCIIYEWMPKLNQNDEWADVAKSNIEKWIELLVDHLDMCAHDAMEYVKLLRSHDWPKKYRKFITSKVSEYCRVMFLKG